MDAKRRAAEGNLVGAPPLDLADEAGWRSWRDNNTDPYGAAVFSYAERWARLMQAEMARGEPIEAVAERASHEADVEGISGFQYGAAVSVLEKCWKHGDRLREATGR